MECLRRITTPVNGNDAQRKVSGLKPGNIMKNSRDIAV
ncbi:hypothetical protein AC26_0620 [Escherichia coli 1-176-05_S3_C2]|nr:hypothetical protein AC26_0620 [Escherichia coli 1-176-05_S3_C2]